MVTFYLCCNEQQRQVDEQEQLVGKKQWLDGIIQHERSMQLMRVLRMGCSCMVSTLPQAADMPSRRQAF